MAKSLILSVLFVSLISWQYQHTPNNSEKNYLIKNIKHNMILFIISYGIQALLLFRFLPSASQNTTSWSWVMAIFCILYLDLITYFWHRLNHQIPWLWKFHKVHHSDNLLNTSSALRFHFVEVILGTLFRIGFFTFLQLPWHYYFIHELVFQFFNFTQHTKIALNNKLNKIISYVFISPSVHHYHHNILLENSKSYNLSTIFSFWDRCFKTYHYQNAFVDCGLKDQENTAQDLLHSLMAK